MRPHRNARVNTEMNRRSATVIPAVISVSAEPAVTNAAATTEMATATNVAAATTEMAATTNVAAAAPPSLC